MCIAPSSSIHFSAVHLSSSTNVFSRFSRKYGKRFWLFFLHRRKTLQSIFKTALTGLNRLVHRFIGNPVGRLSTVLENIWKYFFSIHSNCSWWSVFLAKIVFNNCSKAGLIVGLKDFLPSTFTLLAGIQPETITESLYMCNRPCCNTFINSYNHFIPWHLLTGRQSSPCVTSHILIFYLFNFLHKNILSKTFGLCLI